MGSWLKAGEIVKCYDLLFNPFTVREPYVALRIFVTHLRVIFGSQTAFEVNDKSCENMWVNH